MTQEGARSAAAEAEAALGVLNQPTLPPARRLWRLLEWERGLLGTPPSTSAGAAESEEGRYSTRQWLELHLRLVPSLGKVIFPWNRWERQRGQEARQIAEREFGIRFTPETAGEFLCEVFRDRIYTRFEDFLPAFHGTVLDVGAQFGDFSLLCTRALGTPQVHAFEPVPWVFDVLNANLRLNRETRVHTVRSFVSDVDLTPGREDPPSPGRPAGTATPVTLCTIDSFDLKGVTLLKIDVEGAEMRVLRGARRLLQEQAPWIILETHSLRLDREVERHLTALGYARRHAVELMVFPVPGFDRCRNVFYAPTGRRAGR